MAKRVTDVLRRGRARALVGVTMAERSADNLEKEAAQLRANAAELRALHCQLGASIQVLDGDAAPLDFPEHPSP